MNGSDQIGSLNSPEKPSLFSGIFGSIFLSLFFCLFSSISVCLFFRFSIFFSIFLQGLN